MVRRVARVPAPPAVPLAPVAAAERGRRVNDTRRCAEARRHRWDATSVPGHASPLPGHTVGGVGTTPSRASVPRPGGGPTTCGPPRPGQGGAEPPTSPPCRTWTSGTTPRRSSRSRRQRGGLDVDRADQVTVRSGAEADERGYRSTRRHAPSRRRRQRPPPPGRLRASARDQDDRDARRWLGPPAAAEPQAARPTPLGHDGHRPASLVHRRGQHGQHHPDRPRAGG